MYSHYLLCASHLHIEVQINDGRLEPLEILLMTDLNLEGARICYYTHRVVSL